MSSTSSWWARKLGTEPAPQPAQPQWSPQQYAQPQGQPQSYPATGPGYHGPPPQGMDPNTVQVTKDNVVALTGLWKGGKGTATETQRCPECGGADYFTRQNVSGSRIINTSSGMAASAAPHCFDCGFSGGLYPTQGQPRE